MHHTTIIIHWRGPFSLDDINDSDDGDGLYLLTGKQPYQRNEQIQYCGITEDYYRRRLAKNVRVHEITRDLGIWLGSIVYPVHTTREHLEMAETLIIYFWQPDLNERKKASLPRPTTVLSHWFKSDGTPRIYQMPIYRDLPDVLCWDGAFWRTGNLTVRPEANFLV